MRIQSWNYLDTVEVIGSIPVAPIFKVKQIANLQNLLEPGKVKFR